MIHFKCGIYIMWLFNIAKQVITTTWTIPSSQWNQSLLLDVIILSLLDSGHSRYDISSQTGVSVTSISRLRSRHRPYIKKASGGRPSKLSEQDICYAIWLIGTGKAENAVQVTKALQHSTNQPLSAQTVQNSMKEVGMKAVVKKKRPLLTKRHRRERLDFSLSHKDWTDETKINCFGSDGAMGVGKKWGRLKW